MEITKADEDKYLEKFTKQATYSPEWEKYSICSMGWQLVSGDTRDLFLQFIKQEKLGHTKHKLNIKPEKED